MKLNDMTDKQFLEFIKDKFIKEEYFYGVNRLQNIIDNMPNTEALVAEAKKRVDMLCEKRKIPENVLANEGYLVDSYLFHPSIKSSNL